MKNFFFVCWIFFIFFFSSCMREEPLSEDEILVNEIQREIAKDLYKKYKLTLSSEGASMMDEIKEISLGFFSQKQCTVDDARDILVDASELLLRKINNNEKIRKYLVRYPFTVKGIDLCVFFIKNGESFPPPYVYTAWNNNGKIEYEVKEVNSEEIKIIHEETYENALKQVHENQRKKP